MRPGHGEVVIAEGDVELTEDRERLIEEFRRQLDEGLWAAVPTCDDRRDARMVTSFEEVPADSERVIFFPRAAGGSGVPGGSSVPGGSGAPTGSDAPGESAPNWD
jgi:hypothetical protein